MFRKTKVYLDTSVISHLDADDVPDRMEETLTFWQTLQLGLEFEVFLSDLTNRELLRCYEPKRSHLIEFLSEIEYETISETKEIRKLADKYLDYRVLSKKDFDDLLHISHAVVSRCDCIVSWNFKHFVNFKTMDRVNAINLMEGYHFIKILTPQMMIGGEYDNES